jgi:deoxycytidylate deaminase
MSSDRKNKQYMQMCIATANIFSTCGKKKYAAVLVDKNDHIVGIGYNGGPRGFQHCEDGGCPRFQEMSDSGSIYDNCIAVHAEANALLHSDYSSQAYRIYVNGPPCFSCAKLIANSTVEQVYYIGDSLYKDWENINSFLYKANVLTYEIEI